MQVGNGDAPVQVVDILGDVVAATVKMRAGNMLFPCFTSGAAQSVLGLLKDDVANGAGGKPLGDLLKWIFEVALAAACGKQQGKLLRRYRLDAVFLAHGGFLTWLTMNVLTTYRQAPPPSLIHAAVIRAA